MQECYAMIYLVHTIRSDKKKSTWGKVQHCILHIQSLLLFIIYSDIYEDLHDTAVVHYPHNKQNKNKTIYNSNIQWTILRSNSNQPYLPPVNPFLTPTTNLSNPPFYFNSFNSFTLKTDPVPPPSKDWPPHPIHASFANTMSMHTCKPPLYSTSSLSLTIRYASFLMAPSRRGPTMTTSACTHKWCSGV